MEIKKMLGILSILIIGVTHHVVRAKVIVFFPTPFISHVRYHTDVARAISGLGHEPWVCIPEYITATSHVDTSGINVLHYGHSIGDVDDFIKSRTRFDESFMNNKTLSVFDILNVIFLYEEISMSILNEGIIEKVGDLKADLFVLDGVPLVTTMIVVPYKLDIPYAFIGTTFDPVAYRIPFSPATTPMQFATFNDVMSFSERVQNAILCLLVPVSMYLIKPNTIPMFAPDKPHTTVQELVAKAEIYILDIDPVFDYPKPTLPNVKLVGGLAVRRIKPLKDPFKTFLDKSTKGVILVSFGSIILNIPDYIFDKINSAGLETGLNVVWRSNHSTPNPDRILTSDWLPQNDILGHENTKLFVSHCGGNGQYEAFYHGIPILCLPIFGDQPYNAERVPAKGFGMKADVRSITRDELATSFHELLTNASYKNNVMKAAAIFRQLYKSPMNESAFWLDHVMQYGGSYMRAASQKIPLYKYLMLDVLVFIATSLVIILATFYVLLRFCIRRVYNSVKSSKPKSE